MDQLHRRDRGSMGLGPLPTYRTLAEPKINSSIWRSGKREREIGSDADGSLISQWRPTFSRVTPVSTPTIRFSIGRFGFEVRLSFSFHGMPPQGRKEKFICRRWRPGAMESVLLTRLTTRRDGGRKSSSTSPSSYQQLRSQLPRTLSYSHSFVLFSSELWRTLAT